MRNWLNWILYRGEMLRSDRCQVRFQSLALHADAPSLSNPRAAEIEPFLLPPCRTQEVTASLGSLRCRAARAPPRASTSGFSSSPGKDSAEEPVSHVHPLRHFGDVRGCYLRWQQTRRGGCRNVSFGRTFPGLNFRSWPQHDSPSRATRIDWSSEQRTKILDACVSIGHRTRAVRCNFLN